jgi:hypothetical protein
LVPILVVGPETRDIRRVNRGETPGHKVRLGEAGKAI